MEIVKIIGPLILAFIMFSLGIGLTLSDFKRVFIQPKDFLVGLLSQVFFLPTIALILALVIPIPVELKVGLILIAIAPGGVTTNIITKYANGDVALSISLTAIISLLCFITIPIFFTIAYPLIAGENLIANYSLGKIILQIFLITTVPVSLGMFLKFIFPSFLKKIEKYLLNLSFLFFLLVLFSAIYSELPNIKNYFAASGLITLTLNVSVLIFAYFLCRFFNIGKIQEKTILIETGLQNGTLSIVLTSLIFDDTIYLVPIATYALIMYFVIILYIAGLSFFDKKY